MATKTRATLASGAAKSGRKPVKRKLPTISVRLARGMLVEVRHGGAWIGGSVLSLAEHGAFVQVDGDDRENIHEGDEDTGIVGATWTHLRAIVAAKA